MRLYYKLLKYGYLSATFVHMPKNRKKQMAPRKKTSIKYASAGIPLVKETDFKSGPLVKERRKSKIRKSELRAHCLG